jgi:hypothetical protein
MPQNNTEEQPQNNAEEQPQNNTEEHRHAVLFSVIQCSSVARVESGVDWPERARRASCCPEENG